MDYLMKGLSIATHDRLQEGRRDLDAPVQLPSFLYRRLAAECEPYVPYMVSSPTPGLLFNGVRYQDARDGS